MPPPSNYSNGIDMDSLPGHRYRQTRVVNNVGDREYDYETMSENGAATVDDTLGQLARATPNPVGSGSSQACGNVHPPRSGRPSGTIGCHYSQRCRSDEAQENSFTACHQNSRSGLAFGEHARVTSNSF